MAELPVSAAVHAGSNDRTVRWMNPGTSGKVETAGGRPGRSVPIAGLFALKQRVVIGRAPDCDILLPHPSVSRYHAELERRPDGLCLSDRASVNGVLLDGRRLDAPAVLRGGECVGVGPYLFRPVGGSLHILDSSQSLRLEARNLEKVVRQPDGQTRKLLDNINLAVEAGEFVCLLGPSGSGKSTLMDCLNGRRPATGGQVLANGEDFYRHFDNFRQSLGYVPQRDIVHAQLTVAQALYYTARLRLPTDTGPNELQTRIREVMRQMELEPHEGTLVADLSGGQVKRVSLGAELLARPCVLYIDEATSGLDAGTEARMMRLFRQLADEGKSLVCITHNVDNVDLCDLILVLMRGKLAYFGPPDEGRDYFGVPRVSAIYDRLAGKAPEEWEKEFRATSLHAEFVKKRLANGAADSQVKLAPTVPAGPPRPEAITRERPHRLFRHQFAVLTARYARLLWTDRRSLRLLFLQAPIVAVFILLGFVNKPYQDTVLAPRRLTDVERAALGRVLEFRKAAHALDPSGRVAERIRQELDPHDRVLAPLVGMLDERALAQMAAETGPVVPDRVIVNPRYTYMLLYIVVITVLWFGCNNAAKEIVKEEAVYLRERAVNLGIAPYLASKFVVLAGVAAVQVLLLMACIYVVLEALQAFAGMSIPPAEYRLGYGEQFGVLWLLELTGAALGLLLSACVSSPDRASTLLPYVLIPQIILGGGIMPIRSGLLYLTALVASPAYWAFRGIRLGESTLPPDFPGYVDCYDSVALACVALGVQTVVLLGLTAWMLHRKDVCRA